MEVSKYSAIDPMALILSGRAYLIWVELHNPNEPALARLAEVVKSLNHEEKTFALARAKAMVAYGRAVEQSLEGHVGRPHHG
ncbi:hypothetical protein FNU76_22315 [Chitinimonas arctica]|uniref:Uncharacterized protein n=1 Tax=Chitinimonas arctica TaxID=2594795 RepID=A0A516SL63_9NEIS|nr:hypothetical protein [Chitinimonas arctica]QDQ28863.1 hypothetical protein FNU76_22315 [Chitinimonas arctica]